MEDALFPWKKVLIPSAANIEELLSEKEYV
jgi:hypothetical protein